MNIISILSFLLLSVVFFQFVFCAESTLTNSDQNKIKLNIGEEKDNTFCENLSNCADCVENGCKFCNGLGCVPNETAEYCERGYITSQSNERECPSGNKAEGVSLAPFACFIVLFSFIISIL